MNAQNSDNLDVIVPVYNEHVEVVSSTVSGLKKAFEKVNGVNIIVVDDGSSPEYGLSSLASVGGVTLVQHEVNLGYGAALKTGILTGAAPWIAIIDADGTYPVEMFCRLMENLGSYDMVMGVRTREVNKTPWLRKLPKFVLNLFASYITNQRVKDLNTGMRVFSRELCYYLWDLFPAGFSFTSTLTIGALSGGFRLKEYPIDYHERVGQSSIHPIKDTIRFFKVSFRLGLLFAPLKIFGPMALLLFLIGASKGFLKDYPTMGGIGNFAVMMMLSAIQIFMLGLLGELIVHSRTLKRKGPPS